MVDFTQFASKPAGEAKRPPVLPADDYLGIVKSFELGDENANHTPYVRFAIGLLDWGPNVPDEWPIAAPDGTVQDISKSDIDLSKRQMRRDYYITDEALWRLDEFIRSCGVEPSGRSYGEIIPELIGKQVTVKIEQYLNKRTNEIGNQVGQLIGLGN